jgi:small subunit ribosomal protein S20
MPVIRSAKKKVRVDKRREAFNNQTERVIRSSVSNLKKSPVAENLSVVFSSIDKAAKNGVIHKNKAARMKARYAKLLTLSTATKKPAAKKKASVAK